MAVPHHGFGLPITRVRHQSRANDLADSRLIGLAVTHIVSLAALPVFEFVHQYPIVSQGCNLKNIKLAGIIRRFIADLTNK